MNISLKPLAGFTLLEFIITLIILSILMVGVYIAWPGLTVSLDAQAYQLASDIRYTQALSMSKGERYRFVKLSSTTYQITNSAGTAIILPRGVTTITLNSGITFGTLTNLPNNLIAFDGKGIPYTDTGSPGTALSSTATLPLTASGETKTVSVTPETGRVSVS